MSQVFPWEYETIFVYFETLVQRAPHKRTKENFRIGDLTQTM